MILVTHSLIGSALTHSLLNRATVFFVGVMSHYLADMIPHWHYNIPRVKKAVNGVRGRKTLEMRMAFVPDLVRITIDLAFGFLFSFIIFGGSPDIIALGVLGAVFPDLLVGCARFYPARILVLHDRFHHWIHTNIMLDDSPVLGISMQVVIALVFIVLFQ